MKTKKSLLVIIKNAFILLMIVSIFSCKKESQTLIIDRFSDAAATFYRRSLVSGLPDPNAPINFDQPMFLIQAFAAGGNSSITYLPDTVYAYNFDARSKYPDQMFIFVKEGTTQEISGQNRVVNYLPGDDSYNDFHWLDTVVVPTAYETNSIKSYDEIIKSGNPIRKGTAILNTPIVPFGSTASKRYMATDNTGLEAAWYQNQLVYYFSFLPVLYTTADTIPQTFQPNNALSSDVFVMYNKQPEISIDNLTLPPIYTILQSFLSGYLTASSPDITCQDPNNPNLTHNLFASLPYFPYGNTTPTPSYSGYWAFNISNNAGFCTNINYTNYAVPNNPQYVNIIAGRKTLIPGLNLDGYISGVNMPIVTCLGGSDCLP